MALWRKVRTSGDRLLLSLRAAALLVLSAALLVALVTLTPLRSTHDSSWRVAAPSTAVFRNPVPALPAASQRARPASAAQSATIRHAFSRIPMHFEPNVGQTRPDVRYLARGRGFTLFLTDGEAVLRLSRDRASRSPESDAIGIDSRRVASAEEAVVRMRLAGANASARVTGEDPLEGRVNYLSEATRPSGAPTSGRCPACGTAACIPALTSSTTATSDSSNSTSWRRLVQIRRASA